MNDFVIRAAALALRAVPECNALWDPKTQSAVTSGSVDISVAVATDNGLITPIVKAADGKRLEAIGAEVKVCVVLCVVLLCAAVCVASSSESVLHLLTACFVWCVVVWCGVVWCGVVWCGQALAAKARAGKLQPAEFIGGTFTYVCVSVCCVL